jgi:gamma-glutamylcyclotransferase (GGCT)/AIG2-like uncharacterized protein YtfP
MGRYFAYGSNLLRRQMRVRCPDSREIGRARLADWRLALVAPGYCGVLPEAGASVEGVLHDLTEADEATLDIHEGVPRHYLKRVLPVISVGGVVDALVYLPAAATAASHRQPGYVERVLEGAAEQRLPSAYLADMRAWLDLPVDPTAPERVLIAVYGTLRRGESNWRRFLAGAESRATVRVAGFTLHDAGAWPYAMRGTPADEITVELFDVDGGSLFALDTLEGVPDHYTREPVETPLGAAWIYLAPSLPAGTRPIPGGDWVTRLPRSGA